MIPLFIQPQNGPNYDKKLNLSQFFISVTKFQIGLIFYSELLRSFI